MINPICERCGKEMEEFGAILLSPPEISKYDGTQTVEKIHICVLCWPAFLEVIDNLD